MSSSAGLATRETPSTTQSDGSDIASLPLRRQVKESEELAELLEEGRDRGLLRMSEILASVEQYESPVEAAELIAKHLRRAGVVVLEDLSGPAAPQERGSFTSDSVRLYLNEIGRVNLLDAELEADLAKRIEAGLSASALLDDPELPLSPTRRAQLRYVERGGVRAREHLIEANLRLVVSLAKRYLGSGLPMSDLVQEGNLGLMRAVTKFDATKGYKFSTYATWWIRQMISRAIADQSRTIRLPVHLFETINRVARTERSLATLLGHEPTTAEVAEAMGMTEAKIEQLKGFSTATTSLDSPVGDEGNASIGDLIVDDGAVMPVEAVATILLHDDMAEVLRRLPERERRVLELRFGLVGQPPMTLEQVGRAMELTRERIRQIESKGLARLRHPANLTALEGYLD